MKLWTSTALAHRDRPELIRSAVTDKSGKFTFRGVPPGTYKIFAWESLEPNAYYDPQILRQYEDQRKQVRVLESDKAVVEVKMIPARQQVRPGE